MAQDRKEKNKNPERKGIVRKFKEVGSELKKVSWPGFGKTVKNTGVVLAVVAIFLVIILIFDLILSYGVHRNLSPSAPANVIRAAGAMINAAGTGLSRFVQAFFRLG